MIASVALALLAVEVFVRVAGRRLSLDLARIGSFPKVAKALHDDEKRPRILLVGNSLMGCGFDRSAFQAAAGSVLAGPPAVEAQTFNGSEVTEWHRVLQDYFAAPGARPDVMVIGDGHHTAFADMAKIRIGRLAHLCRLRSAAGVLRHDLSDFAQRAGLVHSMLSASYASRDGISAKVLGKLLPCYEEGVKWVHQRLRVVDGKPPAPDDAGDGAAAQADQLRKRPPPPTYRRLVRLLQTVGQADVKVVLVLMPIVRGYEVPQDMLDAAKAHGAHVLDCRTVQGLAPGLFADTVHMSPKGAAVFSAELGRRLAQQIPHLLAEDAPPTTAPTPAGTHPPPRRN